jgi:hypothetical protein
MLYMLRMGKPPGRPRRGKTVTEKTRFGVFLDDSEIEALDQWRREQRDPPTRPEAIRLIVLQVLMMGRGK